MNLNLIAIVLKMNIVDGLPAQEHMPIIEKSQVMVFLTTVVFGQDLHLSIFGHFLNARQTTLNQQNQSVGTGRQRETCKLLLNSGRLT